jgi:hypothetical protein
MTTTLARFEQWLRAHDPEEVVGISGLSDACPLTCFKAEVDGCYVETWPDGETPHHRSPLDGRPSWEPGDAILTAFINEVDELEKPIDDRRTDYYPGVTAEEALTILERVKGELG